MSSKSRSKSTSFSGSEDVYQDVHGCCKNQYNNCTSCGQNAMNVNVVVENSNHYQETVKYILNQLSHGDTYVTKENPEDLSEEEPISHYYYGGYHVIRLGEFLNQMRYLILRKLGWDELSTQWLARDVEKNRYVMINIYKSSETHTEYANNMINALTQIQELPSEKIMKLLDHFKVTGINGTHVCTVTDVISECLSNFMIRQKFQPTPVGTAKAIIHQILQGLRDLHVNNKLVHTNIKPESIFFKADNVYITSLVYETYTAFKRCIVPTSFVCNLPDRLSHFRTNIADVYPHIQTKILLLDKELEILVNREESILNQRRKQEMSDDELGVNLLQGEISSFRFPDTTNSLMKRLSRYIKSKINLQQLSTSENKNMPLKTANSMSDCTSPCSNASKCKATNSTESTNYRSSQSTCSSSSEMSSDFDNENNRNKEQNDLLQRQHEIYCVTKDELVLQTQISKSKIQFGCFCQRETESTDEASGEDDSKSEHGDNLEEIIKEKQSFGNEVIDNVKDIFYHTQLEEIGEKEVENQTENMCNQDTELLPNSIDLPTSYAQGSVDIEKERNVAKDDDGDETKYNIEMKTEALDDIKTTPAQSDDDEREIESHNTRVSCDSKTTDDCRCYHCQGHNQSSSHGTNNRSSQEDSSYSTSTSTQESYSEFLLSYCKHNTLCTNYSKYLKRITTCAHSTEKQGKEDEFEIVITDVENARIENDQTIGKEDNHRQYKAIELIYKKEFDFKIDIWSVACLTFELVTGDYLVNPFETKYYTIDEHQILKLIEIMSEIPPDLMENERCIRNIKPMLEREHQFITSMSAQENFYRMLSKSYRTPKEDAKQLLNFLIPMLQLNPHKRATVEECLQSEWFTNKKCSKCTCLK